MVNALFLIHGRGVLMGFGYSFILIQIVLLHFQRKRLEKVSFVPVTGWATNVFQRHRETQHGHGKDASDDG